MVIGPSARGRGILADGNSYDRLVRRELWLTLGHWFDKSFPGLNAPFMDTFHRTRLFDVPLVALAAPVMLTLDLNRSLFWSGILISPIIHIALAIRLAWAGPAAPRRGRGHPPGARGRKDTLARCHHHWD